MSAPGAISPNIISPRVLDGGSGWETGNALLFDGVNDVVNLASQISFSGAFTWVYWFNEASLSIHFDDSPGGVAHIRHTAAAGMRIRLGSANNTFDFAADIDFDVWHSLMLTKDGSDNVRLYIDGVESTDGAVEMAGDFDITRMGFVGAGLEYDGIFDDLYIWDEVIGSAADAVSLNNSDVPVDPESVIADATYKYRFNSEGDSVVAVDLGENENNGDLIDFPESGMWVSRL